jgi:hypothetical protein
VKERPARFAVANFRLAARATYDPRTVKRQTPKGPGIAKAGRHRLVATRSLEVWRSSDYGFRELFEAADVMSEGRVRSDRDGPSYYGTTSVLLPFVSSGGLLPDALGKEVLRLVSRDPHARVRAVRIACREARVRSVNPIGRIHAEVVVRSDPRGVRLDVEVEAVVMADERRKARGRGKA